MDPRAGDLTVVQAARRALKDRRAAAVVLYVNSGGGSASASEAMRAALDRIQRETLFRGRHSSIMDLEAPFSREERKLVWAQIQHVYDLFLQRVSESRGMQTEAVIPIAGGRVWTGRQELKNGLVDELGSLRRAIARAREPGRLGRRGARGACRAT